jgi:two-component system response regulator HydG
VDVRVVAATHVDLAEAVNAGRFRDDLYYRLNVVAIHLPPLRERPEDVPLLARSFLERLSHELGKEAEDLSEGAIKALLAHRWPGNVRELENAVERALVTARGRILTEDDFAFLRPVSEAAPGWIVPTHLPLSEVEKTVIAATLRRNEGNVKETAAVLGIDRSTLYDKLKRYGIERG